MRELEIKDWRGKTWRVQFEKHLADGEWAIDWKVLSPDGSVETRHGASVRRLRAIGNYPAAV